jgi:type I restriction enzyme S subunit
VESGVPVIRGGNLSTDGKFNASEFVFVTPEKADQLLPNNAHPGDLVFTQRGTLGQVGIIPDTLPFPRYVISQSQMKLTVDRQKADPTFIYYIFKSSETVQRIHNQAFSSGVPHINLEILRDFEIELPNLPIQRRIASILCGYDDLIDNNTRRIKLLEQMAEMIYREWFVNFRFAGHEKVPMVESELGPIPEGWQTGILRDVCDSMDYGYTASASVEPIGPKFLRITDIVPSVIDWHSVPHCASPEKNADKYALQEGDIVVARTGATTGYAKRLNKRHPAAIFASYLVRLRIKPNFSNHLFGVLVESDEYKRFIQGNWGGAAQPQANAQVLTSFPIVIAPKPLHRLFSALAEPLLDLKETLQFKNLNLRTTRDFLLPKLISGEVPVEAAAELVEQTA